MMAPRLPPARPTPQQMMAPPPQQMNYAMYGQQPMGYPPQAAAYGYPPNPQAAYGHAPPPNPYANPYGQQPMGYPGYPGYAPPAYPGAYHGYQ